MVYVASLEGNHLTTSCGFKSDCFQNPFGTCKNGNPEHVKSVLFYQYKTYGNLRHFYGYYSTLTVVSITVYYFSCFF